MSEFASPSYGGTPSSAFSSSVGTPTEPVPGDIGQPYMPRNPETGEVSTPTPVASSQQVGMTGPPTQAPIPIPGQSGTTATGSVNYDDKGVPVGVQGNYNGGGNTTGPTDLGQWANKALDWAGLPPVFDKGTVTGEASATSTTASGGAGSYTDAEGKQTYGFAGEGTSESGQANATWNRPDGTSSYFNAGVKGPNASAGANTNDSTTQFGAQANAMEGAAEWGNKGTSSDQSTKVGASEGVGFAGRAHYGDADGDKLPEYGFGFDAGPLSFDYKTEDPLRAAAEMACPAVGAASQTAKMLGLDPLADTNFTQGAKDLFKDLF